MSCPSRQEVPGEDTLRAARRSRPRRAGPGRGQYRRRPAHPGRGGDPALQSIVPVPASVTPAAGVTFPLVSTTKIVTEAGSAPAKDVGTYLAGVLRPSTGFALPVSDAPASVPADSIALLLSGAPASSARRATSSCRRRLRSPCGRRRPTGSSPASRRCGRCCPGAWKAPRPRPGRGASRARRSRTTRGSATAARCSTSPGTSSPVSTVEAVHRRARPVQDQQPAPAPGRRPGLAHRRSTAGRT